MIRLVSKYVIPKAQSDTVLARPACEPPRQPDHSRRRFRPKAPEMAKGGRREAWEALIRTSKLAGSGPTFGTKVAYFGAFSPNGRGVRPLIADINISRAMWETLFAPRRSV